MQSIRNWKSKCRKSLGQFNDDTLLDFVNQARLLYSDMKKNWFFFFKWLKASQTEEWNNGENAICHLTAIISKACRRTVLWKIAVKKDECESERVDPPEDERT